MRDNELVKSIQFKNYRYIGDPINAVKVFNDLKADELVFLDIEATKKKRTISLDLVEQVGEEANMPFAVGGGISTLEDIQKIISNLKHAHPTYCHPPGPFAATQSAPPRPNE